MFDLLRLSLGAIKCLFSSRKSLLLENLALRQQLAVLKRKNKRPRLNLLDRFFWIAIKQCWTGWQHCLLIVAPATVVGWHRSGFRLYWKFLSKGIATPGRKRIDKKTRDLIFRMAAENPTWGAPRIHGELLKLGFDISERTVSRWVEQAPRNPESAKRWQAFLHNHREVIAAMDFFAVPTVAFGLLFGLFVIGHGRRRILHFGVTKHPTSCWVAQQLREAFPFEHGQQYLIFDHDGKFGREVDAAINAVGLSAVRTSIRSPWQNGLAERWVGSCRRELLDHIIPLNERHLKRLISEYVRYYHEDRTHLGLMKDTPAGRKIELKSGPKVVSFPRIGGLHHRYELVA